MQAVETKLSVIIPCYNDGAYLLEALASAELSCKGRHEIILVNDGSTDPMTLNVLREIESRGHCVICQENRGLGAARNRGIAAARGQYVLPLDADNRVRSAYIDQAIEVLDRECDVDVVYADAEYFGDRTGRWLVPDFSLLRLLGDNYIDACAVFRKSAWERCNGYDEHMPLQGREDWDLWVRIAMSGGRFYHIPQPLFDYRVRSNSMTSKMAGAESHISVRRHIFSKRVEMTIGDYAEPQTSLDFVISLVRRRPIHTLLALLVRAFIPSLLSPLPSPRHPNSSRDNIQKP